jgi:hypothetical protein
LSREPPVSGLYSTALAVAFCFSNKFYFVCWLVSWVNQLPHKPILWPMKARTLNTSPLHFWQPWRDTSPGPRSVWLSAKPAGVCLRCDHELWSPRSANVTFQEQPKKKKKKGHCYGLQTSHLKLPTLWPQHKKFPPNIDTSNSLWHCDCPGTSFDHPSLTLQVLLQVIHPFVKEIAFHWLPTFGDIRLNGRILEISLHW